MSKKKSQKKEKTLFNQPEAQESIQNNEELAFESLMKVLLIYSKLDRISLIEKYNPSSPQKKAAIFLKSFVRTFDEISSYLRNNTQKSMTDVEVNQEIAKINPDMLYFLLNVTIEEFHFFFIEFYSLFDQEKDYLLSKDEFQLIINYMGSSDQMGKEKLNISLKLFLTKGNILKGALDKFGRFFVTDSNTILAPDIFNELFQELKDNQTWIDLGNKREYFVDFLKFLPILLSYFLEYMRRRIEIRRENLMVY